MALENQFNGFDLVQRLRKLVKGLENQFNGFNLRQAFYKISERVWQIGSRV